MLVDDQILIDKYVKTTSQSAFDELFRRHFKLVYTTCLRDLNDPDLAADTTQAVFLILMQNAPKLRNHAALATWLFKTARYASLGVIRQQKQRRKMEMVLDSEMMENIPCDTVHSIIDESINDALSKISSADREVILLRYFEGYDTGEISRLIGINAEATQKRIRRALVKLRSHLVKASPELTIVTLMTVLNRYADAEAMPHSEITTQTILSGLHNTSIHPHISEIMKGTHTIMNGAMYKQVTIGLLICASLMGSIYINRNHLHIKSASVVTQTANKINTPYKTITLKDGSRLEIFGVTDNRKPLRFWQPDGTPISDMPDAYKLLKLLAASNNDGTYLVGRLITNTENAANITASGEPKKYTGKITSGYTRFSRLKEDFWFLYLNFHVHTSTYKVGFDAASGQYKKTASVIFDRQHEKYFSNNTVFTTKKPKYVSLKTKPNAVYILNLDNDFDRRVSITYTDGKIKILSAFQYDMSQGYIFDKKGGRPIYTIILQPDKIKMDRNIQEIAVEERFHEQFYLDDVHAQPNK